MYGIRYDERKNRLYVELKGTISEDEALALLRKTQDVLEHHLRPGLSVINDLSDALPLPANVAAYISQGQAAIDAKHPSKVIRVVKNIVSAVQFKRTHQEAHIGYTVTQVTSLEEAERLLAEEEESCMSKLHFDTRAA